MVRKRIRRRPQLESLETMVLLSGFSITQHQGAAAMVARQAHPDAAVVLLGSVKGTYKTAGSLTTFSEKGDVSPLGKITLKGSIDYFLAHPSGTGTISSATRKHGKIISSLTTAGPDRPVYFTITSATGIYAGDTGSGEGLVSTVPAKGKGAAHAHGKVTFTFVEVGELF